MEESEHSEGFEPQRVGTNRRIVFILCCMAIMILGVGIFLGMRIGSGDPAPISPVPTPEGNVIPSRTPSSTAPSPTRATDGDLTPPFTPTLPPGAVRYRSPSLGVSFAYSERPTDGSFERIYVFEQQNTICVTYEFGDRSCEAGQKLEVFEKPPNESLEQTITRVFLQDKDPARCRAEVLPARGYPTGFEQGEIRVITAEPFDLERMWEDSAYCSPNYAQTNGIRFFLYDPSKPTKYLFFSIGQYGIMAGENKPWQETVVIE